MCEPATIAAAGLALSAASAGVAYDAQRTQAKNNNKLAEAQARNANDAARRSYEQEQRRLRQVRDASRQKLTERRRQANEDRATARVRAGEAGVSGLSVTALLDNIQRRGLDDEQTIQTNYFNQYQQSQDTLYSIYAGNTSRNNSARSNVSEGPSAAAAGLSLAGAGLNAYTTYRQEDMLDRRVGMKTEDYAL